MDVYLGYERWKHQYLWRENVDLTMSSENSQGYLWIPCEIYSSLANQIMCNKQSALEFCLPESKSGLWIGKNCLSLPLSVRHQQFVFSSYV